jgi:hypothetical protein
MIFRLLRELGTLLLVIGSVVATEAILAAIFVGIGLLIRRGFGTKSVDLDDCFLAFWMGLAATILFLLVWNFVWPVTWVATAFVVLTGLAGLAVSRSSLRRGLETESWRPPVWLAVVIVGAVLWFGDVAIGSLGSWDSSIYHLQAVRWAEAYPAVPGLVNVHGPLAYNNSTFLYFAMLDVGPWAGRANHIGNGLLLTVFVVQCLVAAGRFLTGPAADRPRYLLAALFLPMAFNSTFGQRVSSFGTDIAKLVVLATMIGLWYRFLTAAGRERVLEAYDFVCLVTLGAAAVTLKLHATVFVALALVPTAIVWSRSRSLADPWVRKAGGWAAAIAVAFAIAWCGRGIVLSGYPLFPSSILPAPVEWRAPKEHVDAEFWFAHNSGQASTQLPEVVAGRAGIRAWFPSWLKEASTDPVAWVVPLVVVALALALGSGSRGRPPVYSAGAISRPWWLLVPMVLDLVIWFFTSPELRYETYQFWGLAGLAAAEAMRRNLDAPLGLRARVVAGVALLSLVPRVLTPIVIAYRSHWTWVHSIVAENLIRPGSDHGFQPIAGHARLTTYVTTSGLSLNVPVAFDRCWDAPLPCTENPAPNVRLRVPGRIDRGFVVDGPWAMLNWPYVYALDFTKAWRSGVHLRPASFPAPPPAAPR